MQIDLPEHGLAPDLDRAKIVPSLGIILRLESIERTGGLHRLGHEAVTGLHKRAGDMHSALGGLRGRHSKARELAKRVVLRRDHGRIRTVWLGLNGHGHGISFEKLKHPSRSPLSLFCLAEGPKQKVPYPNRPLGL